MPSVETNHPHHSVRHRKSGQWLHIRRFDAEDRPVLTGDCREAWVAHSEAQAVAQASFLGDDEFVAAELPAGSGMDANEIPIDLGAVMRAVVDLVGEHLDRVIVYGSLINGNWNKETSDIDVAVLLREPPDPNADAEPTSETVFQQVERFQDWRKLTNQIEKRLDELKDREDLGGLADRLNFFVEDAFTVEQLRDFAPTMESKLLRKGLIMWVNPVPRQYSPLPHNEARDYYVQRVIRAATNLVEHCRHQALVLDHRAAAKPNWDWSRYYGQLCVDAHRAACMYLWALCYYHGIDPSDKAMRWRFCALVDRLSAVVPDVARLFALQDKLPDRYRIDGFDTRSTREEARAASAAALKVFRFVSTKAFGDCLEPIASVRSSASRFADALKGKKA